MLEQVPEALRGHDPKVEPESLLRDDGRLGVATRDDFGTHGTVTKCPISAAGSVAVAITSRSRKVSRRRLTQPASDTSTAAGCSRSASTTSRTIGSPTRAGPGAEWSAGTSSSAFRIFASVVAPRPGGAQPLLLRRLLQPGDRRHPELAPDPRSGFRAEARQPHERRRPRRAPRHGVSSGRASRRSSTTSMIFDSIVLPIPGSSFAFPSTASSATENRSRGSGSPRGGTQGRETTAPRGSPRDRPGARAGPPARCSAEASAPSTRSYG